MEVKAVNLSHVDFQDICFYLGNKTGLSSLTESIKEIGLINPPILRQSQSELQIITGWKRLFSLKELGQEEILAKVYDLNEITDADCIKIIYLDNQERLSDLELAELITRYKNICSANDETLINDFLPFLGIPSSRKHLDRYLNLSSLDKEIKNAFYEDKITIEQCYLVSEISGNSQVPLFKLLLFKYNLNNNESRQVILLIEEIALRDLKPVSEVILQAERNLDSETKGKNELRQELRKMRYPDLASVEEKYRRILDELSLPKQLTIHTNSFFESNDLELRIKIKSLDDLIEIKTFLGSKNAETTIDRLLNLIKKGS